MRLRLVDAVKVPAVPVMVTFAFPAVAALLALSLRPLLPVAGSVAKSAVTPFGRPVAARVTFPENAPPAVTSTVPVPLLP